MEKVDQHLIESMKALVKTEPENYLEDYVYLTYDYAWFVAEEGRYEEVADLLKESLDGLIQMKTVFKDSYVQTDILQDMALGYHDLMIETAEGGYYELALEVREWIQKMLDTYGIKIKNK